MYLGAGPFSFPPGRSRLPLAGNVPGKNDHARVHKCTYQHDNVFSCVRVTSSVVVHNAYSTHNSTMARECGLLFCSVPVEVQ